MTKKTVIWGGAFIVLMGILFTSVPKIAPFVSGVLPLLRTPEAITELETLPFTLPEGFAVTLFASDLGAPRVMTYDPRGTLLVSIPSDGRVVALPNMDGDQKADRTVTVIEGLNKPHGILFFENKLYIAETSQVGVYTYDSESMTARFERTIAKLPTDGYNQHYTRSLHRISLPEGERLLVSIGSSCNVCVEEDPRRAKILSMTFDGGDQQVFARGVRNTVFMATHPVTGDVWGTDMGRDLLGDDTPPDEVNILTPRSFANEQGAVEPNNYGWPICYGKNIHDTAFDTNTYIRNPCMEPFETPSHIDIPAHSAPLGIAFIPEEGWPEEYWHNALVAYHGSWNRSVPTGYKVVRMKLDAEGNYLGVSDFMTGFIRDGVVIGRPVAIIAEPGGSLYISDDRAGAIYRVIRTTE